MKPYPYVPYVTRMFLVVLVWCFSHDRALAQENVRRHFS